MKRSTLALSILGLSFGATTFLAACSDSGSGDGGATAGADSIGSLDGNASTNAN